MNTYEQSQNIYCCNFSFGGVNFSAFLDPTFFEKRIIDPKVIKTSYPTHNHVHHELIAVLNGSITTKSSEHSVSVHSGECLFCPAKLIHATQNVLGTEILSIGFTFKKSGRKADDVFTYFSELLNPNKPIVLKNQKELFDKIVKIKKVLLENQPLYHFEIQTLLQEIVLLLCRELNKLSERKVKNPNLYSSNNLSFLINLKLNVPIANLNLNTIAKELFISPRQLERLIKNIFGMSFAERRAFLRTESAKNLLIETDLSIEEISNIIGFSDKSGFYRVFTKTTGQTPASYRKQHKHKTKQAE